MLTLIRATYFFLTAFLPLSFLPRASELFEFPKFLILLGCTIVVAVSWLAYTYTHKDWQIPLGRYKAISYGVLAILATQALATLFSIHPYTSFWGYYTRFHQGLFSTICYTILYFGTLKFLNVRDVKKLIKVSVGVAYGSDIARVRQIVLDESGKHPRVLKSPPPSFSFDQFGSSTLDISVFCRVALSSDQAPVASELREQLLNRFRQEGIQIPLPQLVITKSDTNPRQST